MDQLWGEEIRLVLESVPPKIAEIESDYTQMPANNYMHCLDQIYCNENELFTIV